MLTLLLALASELLVFAGGSFDDDDHSNDQLSYFGFVRDTRGLGVGDAKVTAEIKDRATIVTRTDTLGVYRLPGFSKDTDPGKDHDFLRQGRLPSRRASCSARRRVPTSKPSRSSAPCNASDARVARPARCCCARLPCTPTVSMRQDARAETAPPALSGIVSSPEEGTMEGVLVSARRDGAAITVTVATDAEGRYRFPADRLSAGRYALTIRAVGYRLDAPQTADIGAPGAQRDLHLRKSADLAAQLTSTEWLISMPGTVEQKRPLIECMSCHTLERALRSRDDADAMFAALQRMPQYANNTTLQRVQKRVAMRHVNEEQLRRTAEYLAGVNLSHGAWPFELKTLPRPKGRATRVIITEYDLPRATIAPHDVRTDAQGLVWYSNFVENTLGRLDPTHGRACRVCLPGGEARLPRRVARARTG